MWGRMCGGRSWYQSLGWIEALASAGGRALGHGRGGGHWIPGGGGVPGHWPHLQFYNKGIVWGCLIEALQQAGLQTMVRGNIQASAG
jgi:hypothetical protein